MIAELPAAFRAGCHWAIYARAICGPAGLPSSDVPAGLPLKARAKAQEHALAVRKLRTHLFPEDPDG